MLLQFYMRTHRLAIVIESARTQLWHVASVDAQRASVLNKVSAEGENDEVTATDDIGISREMSLPSYILTKCYNQKKKNERTQESQGEIERKRVKWGKISW